MLFLSNDSLILFFDQMQTDKEKYRKSDKVRQIVDFFDKRYFY